MGIIGEKKTVWVTVMDWSDQWGNQHGKQVGKARLLRSWGTCYLSFMMRGSEYLVKILSSW